MIAHRQLMTVTLVLVAASSTLAQEPEYRPGLVGQYFRQRDEFRNDTDQPYLVRVDPQVNFDETTGEFFGTKLAREFGVQWSGQLRVDAAGAYEFELRSDDGSRLYVGEQLVLDHAGNHPMRPKRATHVLQPGLHPVRVEYHQAGGGAGCVLSWKPPGADGFTVIPADRFQHRDGDHGAIAWDAATWQNDKFDSREFRQKYGRPFERMDYGPFLSHTVRVSDDNVVNKGVVINVGTADEEAYVLFDTELLRYAAGWTGGHLNMTGVVFDGAHGPGPTPEGEIAFTTKPTPGVGADGPFPDERPRPFGPIPNARYSGLYRDGRSVVLAYTVDGCDVLERPTRVGGGFARDVTFGASSRPTTLVICDAAGDGQTPGVTGPGNVSVRRTDAGLFTATIPPRPAPATYRLYVPPARASDAHAIPPVTRPAGSAPLWPQTVTTTGVLGGGDGPYVVDTLTVPFENPYNSWMRFGGVDFFSDGRAAVCTWSGDVWVVSGIDDTLEKLTWRRYAAGLFQALGLRIVDDQVYVLGRDQITRLHDLDTDGEADFYENFNNDCEVTPSFHEFTMDLHTDAAGNFYYAKGGPVRPGGRGWETIAAHSGTVLRVSRDGKTLDVFATGVRAPNGMSVGPGDVVTVADNEGTWTPTCRLSIVEQGQFIGVPDLAHVEPAPTRYLPPVCWLPHGEVDNSSGGQVWVTSGNRWGPFEGEMLHLSYGKCSLFKVMTERVNGTWQGGVVRFPLEFESGVSRARFNPRDGQLYVAGLRGWQTSAAKDACLQRVRYTGKPVNMPTGLTAHADGVTIAFTAPVDPDTAGDPGSYGAERWNYLWTDDYGSPEVSVDDPAQRRRDEVEITAATVSPDRKRVRLAIPDMKPAMQMKIRMSVDAADGTTMEYTVYNTVNVLGPAGGR